ncbi:MAG: carboxypeptidase-like regulatory domain-containing protein, partial [Flavisolibacter sp.]
MRIFRIYLLIITLCISSRTFCQDNKRTDVNYSNLHFEEFAFKIDSIFKLQLYYSQDDLDSFIVSIQAKNVTAKELLEKVFQNTPFKITYDGESFYITKYISISTDLPISYFNHSMSVTDSISIKEPMVQEINSRNKNKLPVENRLFEIGIKSNITSNGMATLAGYVRDAKNGEAISGASVYIDSLSSGANTDQYGYYSLIIPKGRHVLTINSLGMQTTKRRIQIYSDGKLNIDMIDFIPTLKTVIVMAQRNSNTRSIQMGVDRLLIKNIKQVPVVFGEADIMKVVLTLPGVTSVGEGSSGFNVRGGSTDQNLILFNDATIYNPTHLFGFFSAFNPDVVKGVELYKSAIPEKFGGRLSSILDVTGKDGNNKKFSGTGGIGPLTSKLTIEGPIIKDKTSFIISGRSSYSDWLLHQIPNSAYQNSSATFYDFTVHLTHEINAKNSIYLTGYRSYDKFSLNKDTTYTYDNLNFNAKWKHIFNNKFYGLFTAGSDRYQYSVTGTADPVNAYKLSFRIKQSNFRTDFNYSL